MTKEEALTNLQVCAARESGGMQRRAFASITGLQNALDSEYRRGLEDAAAVIWNYYKEGPEAAEQAIRDLGKSK